MWAQPRVVLWGWHSVVLTSEGFQDMAAVGSGMQDEEPFLALVSWVRCCQSGSLHQGMVFAGADRAQQHPGVKEPLTGRWQRAL